MVRTDELPLSYSIILMCLCTAICAVLTYCGYVSFNYAFGEQYTTGTVRTANVATPMDTEEFAEIEDITRNATPDHTIDYTTTGNEETVANSNSYEILSGAQQHISVVPSNLSAWLKVDGVDVNDPVMQAKNNTYYLSHNELGEPSRWGCYFASAYNDLTDVEHLDRKTIIFGHSNGNATKLKFSTLKLFKDQSFAEQNPFIYLTVNGVTTTWQIFAESDYPVEDSAIMQINPSDSVFKDEILKMKQLSYNQYDVTVQYTDKVLYLVTCTGESHYETRYIVAAKLIDM